MKIALACLATFLGMASWAMAQDEKQAEVPAALNFTVKNIDGDDVDLAEYKGKVVVIVNVASRCGLTPQYAKLQALYNEYQDEGLVILAFPCNQFNGQEPGTEEEIKTFCSANYNVTFDLFSKIDVKGNNQSDLYRYLTSLKLEPQPTGDITWNFEKFILDREGNPIARFSPRTSPDNEEFVATIKEALGKKALGK